MDRRKHSFRVSGMMVLAALVVPGLLQPQNRVAGGGFEDVPTIELLTAEIAILVRECVDENRAVDVCELTRKIESLPPVFEGKDQTIETLGRLLVFDGDVHIKDGAQLTGRAPVDVLKSAVVRAFARFADKSALPYLQAAYASGGASKYSGLEAAIKDLGGSLPAVKQEDVEEEPGPRITEAERQARRAEVRELSARIKEEDLPVSELDMIIRRIGRIGGPQDVRVIVERLKSDDVHWVVKQDALEALGYLGGGDARRYLIGELTRPMPSGAQLDDYGDCDAILRSQSALALGNCGDGSVAELLVKMADDPKQFRRVRESCRRAAARIREGLRKEAHD